MKASEQTKKQKIQFRGPSKDTFLNEVRRRIDNYFTTTGHSTYANSALHFKGVLLFSGFWLFWSALMFGFFPSIPRIILWILFGVNQGLLAMNVGHDALHGSYSPSSTLNRWLGYLSYDLVGLSSIVWKHTHNQGHHIYTNIAGHDPDIEKPGLLRLCPQAPLYKVHRYQHWYIWLLYSMVGVNWILYTDYQFVWRKRKSLPYQDLIPFFLFKMANLSIMIILPLLLSPMSWQQVAIGYVGLQCAGGLTVSIIFQLAHVVENVEFPLPNEKGVIPENWGVHEMRTTSNFSTRNPFVTQLFGGLNFQIEHHLVPKVSHAHYLKISPIVKQTAKEFGLPYHEKPSLGAAIASHTRLLKKFGREEEIRASS